MKNSFSAKVFGGLSEPNVILVKVMGRQSEKNDLKKTHAISYTLGTFSVDMKYILIN